MKIRLFQISNFTLLKYHFTPYVIHQNYYRCFFINYQFLDEIFLIDFLKNLLFVYLILVVNMKLLIPIIKLKMFYRSLITKITFHLNFYNHFNIFKFLFIINHFHPTLNSIIL